MRQKLILRLWGPAGEACELELPNDAKILPTLMDWAGEIGCRVDELDYQVNDGLRVLGEASARGRHIDVCGLPRGT